MYGVVALLDDEHHAKIETIWMELKKKLGVHGVSSTPIPHFSFHVAETYNLDKLDDIMQREIKLIDPFTVRTNGLGIFTGPQPVLYVPVLNTPYLLDLHNRLWDQITPVSSSPVNYYHPDLWRTHITLTHNDVDHNTLPKVIQLLSARSFTWEIKIEKIAVISNSNDPSEVIHLSYNL